MGQYRIFDDSEPFFLSHKYLIKPMFEVLFEMQTKPNLKFLSQRILDFLLNVKHSTKKINEAQLPSVESLFELLSQLIQFSCKSS